MNPHSLMLAPNQDHIYQNVCQYGQFYNPACSHYGYNSANVVCDKCKKHHLDVCVGYDKYDLCLKCVQEISKNCSGQNKHQSGNRDPIPPVALYGKFTRTSHSTFPPVDMFEDTLKNYQQ